VDDRRLGISPAIEVCDGVQGIGVEPGHADPRLILTQSFGEPDRARAGGPVKSSTSGARGSTNCRRLKPPSNRRLASSAIRSKRGRYATPRTGRASSNAFSTRPAELIAQLLRCPGGLVSWKSTSVHEGHDQYNPFHWHSPHSFEIDDTVDLIAFRPTSVVTLQLRMVVYVLTTSPDKPSLDSLAPTNPSHVKEAPGPTTAIPTGLDYLRSVLSRALPPGRQATP